MRAIRHEAWPRFAPLILIAAMLACAGGRSGSADPVPGDARSNPGDASPAAAESGTAERGQPPIEAAPAVAQPNPADVAFTRAMIAHHAQAIAMADMVADRTDTEAIGSLAGRIDVSQKDEIALMRRWLEARGVEAPDPLNAGDGDHGHAAGAAQPKQAHAAAGHEAQGLMPGMLTAAELERLAAARGAAFDRLFLESMIRHHEGALVMVVDLLATEGAAADPELYIFVGHIDADQRAEIERMRRMLAALQSEPEHRGPT